METVHEGQKQTSKKRNVSEWSKIFVGQTGGMGLSSPAYPFWSTDLHTAPKSNMDTSTKSSEL